MKVLVELLREYSRECETALGLDVRAYRMAGHRVEMRFAGPRWSDTLTKAFSHLPGCPGKAHLTVHLWDGSIQPRDWMFRAYLKAIARHWFDYVGPRGELLDADGPLVRAFFQPGPEILSVVDLEEDTAFYWKSDGSEMPYYESGSPLRTLLHTWMRNRGVQFFHAAAVGRESGGVLLAGKSGSGKSTAAMACLDSSLKYASDDYCMAAVRHREFRIYSLYNTAKLTGENDLKLFPGFAPWVWNRRRRNGEKVVMFLQEHASERIIREFPLRAILLPTITTSAGASLEPCGPREALFSLAPSTFAQLPASGPDEMAFAVRMVRELPCYRLLVGSDLAAIPRTIVSLLDSIRESSTVGSLAETAS